MKRELRSSPEISSVEDSPEVALENKHGRSRAVVGVKNSHTHADSLRRSHHMQKSRLPYLQFHLRGEEDTADRLAREERGKRRLGEERDSRYRLTMRSGRILNLLSSRRAVNGVQ